MHTRDPHGHDPHGQERHSHDPHGHPPVDDDLHSHEPGGERAVAFDPWRYRDATDVTDVDLVGYSVEATDGGIGKVDSASHETDSSYLVVDTGPWIFGKRVMLPAGVVIHVDHDQRQVHVDRTRDQIQAAPEFHEQVHADPHYRARLGGYYGSTYGMPGGLPGVLGPAGRPLY